MLLWTIASASDWGDDMDNATHWDRVYVGKANEELSWFQTGPDAGLEVLDRLSLPKDAPVIDIGGGGPSAFALELLSRGFRDLTILDISEAGLARCLSRLGNHEGVVELIQGDVRRFDPPRRYLLWHDRATLHFLTDAKDQQSYFAVLQRAVCCGGYVLIQTFAPDGPRSCSGLEVAPWTPEELAAALGGGFAMVESLRHNHWTPRGKPQAFTICLFRNQSTGEHP